MLHRLVPILTQTCRRPFEYACSDECVGLADWTRCILTQAYRYSAPHCDSYRSDRSCDVILMCFLFECEGQVVQNRLLPMVRGPRGEDAGAHSRHRVTLQTLVWWQGGSN